MFDKSKKRTEGVTPHSATFHPPSQLFFITASRRAPFVSHMKPPDDAVEDPHAAFSYKLAEEVARGQRGETRFQLRGVEAGSLVTVCEHRFKPLEHALCVESVRCCTAFCACKMLILLSRSD